MELLVTYDVDTTTRDGERRLRRVAKACEGYGYRVQKSVFEVTCSPAQRLLLEAQLLKIIDTAKDSIRIYHLNRNTFRTAQHLGTAVQPTHGGPMIV
jgi:CRISPR-associated protein Cas2